MAIAYNLSESVYQITPTHGFIVREELENVQRATYQVFRVLILGVLLSLLEDVLQVLYPLLDVLLLGEHGLYRQS